MSQAEVANPKVPARPATDRKVLAQVFQHPLSHNLAWRETLALFKFIGAVEHAHDGDVVLRLGDQHQSFRYAHGKDLSAEDVMVLRHFLTRAGWTGGAVPEPAAPAAPDLVVIIDHAGARIFPAATEDGTAPQELHHLLHHITRTQHDADREEGYPADTRFFDAVAAALVGDGRIVVIGHGKGQSNEADHLMAHLARHHSATHARVAREIVADLPHMTVPQLLSLARHALQPAQDSAVPQAG